MLSCGAGPASRARGGGGRGGERGGRGGRAKPSAAMGRVDGKANIGSFFKKV